MNDIKKIRDDFPILSRQIRGKPLVYLDNAATTQKPRAVIAAITEFYEKHNANIHRGVHTLADEATQLIEESRRKTASFIGASSTAQSWGWSLTTAFLPSITSISKASRTTGINATGSTLSSRRTTWRAKLQARSRT